MKVQTNLSTSDVETWEQLRRYVSSDILNIVSVLNGRIGLTDNCQTTLATVSFPSSGMTIAVPHTNRIVPSGYILAGSNADIRIWDGVGINTTSILFLQASGAGIARVLIF